MAFITALASGYSSSSSPFLSPQSSSVSPIAIHSRKPCTKLCMKVIVKDPSNSYFKKYNASNPLVDKWTSKVTTPKYFPMKTPPNPLPLNVKALLLSNAITSPFFQSTSDSIKQNYYQKKADVFMKNSIIKQMKAFGVENGVYSAQCIEGTTKGMAEYSRVAALSKQFRMKQRSVSQLASDYFSSRQFALKAVGHLCNYEESIFKSYSNTAAAYVIGKQEMMKSCERYATTSLSSSESDLAQKYIQKSVQNAMKKRAVSRGIYGLECNDGSVKGMAEYSRVQKEAVNFRARQMSDGDKARAMFNARKVAVDWFTNGCHYEEALIAQFPTAASSLRASNQRY